MTPDIRPLPSPRTLLTLIVVALVAGIALGMEARGPSVLGWDVDVTGSIQRMQGPVVNALADVGNVLGSTLGASIAIALAIIVAAVQHAKPELAFLVTLLVLRLAATQLKPLFDSPRPTDDLVTIIGTWDGTGYPSGHSTTAWTMALGLAVIAWRRIPRRPYAIATIGVLVVLALLVSWARIWTGAHWTSDVIGGFAVGVASVAASTLVLHRVSAPRAATVAARHRPDSSPSASSNR